MMSILFILAGFLLLLAGGEALVRGSVAIATKMGVSKLVIGLTLVGFGTSAPELVTSIQAALSGASGIAIGNVVGSNIFNLLGVLGASAALSSSGIPVNRELIRLDYPVMLAATLVLIPICWNGFAIKRWEGVLLAAFYVAYVAFLVMDAGDSTAPELFRTMMLIVIPIVMLAFFTTGFQGWRKYRAAHPA